MQQLISFLLKNRVTAHLLFWSVVFVCTFFLWHGMSQPLSALKLTSWQIAVKIIIVYLNLYWLMPRYLYTKKYISYSAALLLLFAVEDLVSRYAK